MTTIPVLLVDDSEPDRLFASIVLGRSGRPLEVREFESAADALAELATAPQPPTIILLDINMPGMDGFDFLRAFEQLPEERRRGTSVVMLSSSPLDSDRDRALSHASVKDYMVKPLSVQQARSLADRFGTPA
ncbi:MAG: response regulator [Rubrivivax sp.]|jgi:CheY-like chemotaxis protein|nr:response regulator [Rubrivivax sp.]